MAKATNKSKGSAKAKPKGKAPSRKPNNFAKNAKLTVEFLKSERARKIVALSLILGSVFLLVSFISHFFTGPQDQSVVENGPLGNPDMESPSNWLGSLGAWFGYKFISAGFGVCSLIIPFFTALFGFSLLEKKHFSLVGKIAKYVIFTVLWGSAFLGFITLLFSKTGGELGGGFGNFISQSLFDYMGKPGVGILLALVLGVFLVFNFNPDLSLASLFRGKKENPPSEDVETEEKVEEKTSSVTETAESSSKEPENDSKKEETEDNDFVISVQKLDKKGNPIKEKKEKDKIIELEIEEGPKMVIGEDGKLTEKKEGLETEISSTKPELGTPFELTAAVPVIPPVEKAADGGLTLEIEETKADPVLELSNDDNIVKIDAEKFEKIVPEESKETLFEGEDVGDWEQYDPTKDLSDYQFPPIELLRAFDTAKSREVNRTELEENKNKIVTTLNHYKIEIKHIKATIGPTVTLYEIVPAPGVRISKIRNLEDDIALSLSALGIRIIAPIPGKGTIGIEIPNSNPEIVSMRSTLGTEKFRETKAALPLALGRTISNDVYIADLAKMPHLLIAGATGQGKSVGINGIISSLLYKKHPSQIKFVLIDPKKVELNLYQALEKHFLAKLEGFDEAIITDTKEVIHVLNSLCIEMDGRYDLLKKAKVRNLSEYNEKFINRRLNPRKGHKFMPYIVLVIDEFADLMMTAGKEIEAPIARLAQLARAIGIHLILATQRPSVNVITGIIKANFPARISFRVTSKIDSRTILDTGGADQLIGRGDMLLSTGSELVRIQNAFIDTPEVDKLVDFISEQRGYPTAYYLPEVPDPDGGDDKDVDLSDLDAKFEEAARLIVQHQQGSTSLIQRRLKLGYNRAGRIIDQLEVAGIVGPFSGSKARDVLVQDEFTLEQILNALH